VDPAVCARAQTLAPDESRVASVTPTNLAVERDRHTVLKVVEIFQAVAAPFLDDPSKGDT
jgi:hypothetical protein